MSHCAVNTKAIKCLMRSILIEKERRRWYRDRYENKVSKTELPVVPPYHVFMWNHTNRCFSSFKKKSFLFSRLYCFFYLTTFKQPHQYQSETTCEVAEDVTRKNQSSSDKILTPAGLSPLFPNLSIKHKRISIFSGCQGPNLNHFPLVAGSLPVCRTVTSKSNPQMRIKQGLEIRYEKVLSPLWLLWHIQVFPWVLSISH